MEIVALILFLAVIAGLVAAPSGVPAEKATVQPGTVPVAEPVAA